MATAGPSYPTVGETDSSIGTVGWTAPGNVVSDNGSYASMSGPGTSYYLRGRNFGFSIPTGATINGITVRYEAKMTAGMVIENSLKLVKANVISGNEGKLGTGYSSSDTVYTRGGSSDLWGLTLTASDVNDATFGVGLSVQDMSGTDMFVDYFTLEITYTEVVAGIESVQTVSRRSGRPAPPRPHSSIVGPPFDAAAAVVASSGAILVTSSVAAQAAWRSRGPAPGGKLCEPPPSDAATVASGATILVVSSAVAAHAVATGRGASRVCGPVGEHVVPDGPLMVAARAGVRVPPRPHSRVAMWWPPAGQGICECEPGGVVLVGAGLSVVLVNRGTGVSVGESPLATLQVVLVSRGTLQAQRVAASCDC